MENAETRFLILGKLQEAFPYAVPQKRLDAQLAADGVRLSEPDLVEHLRCLADEGLVHRERSKVDAERICWRLTERGRGWLASQKEGA